MLSVNRSLVETKAAVPHSALLSTVLWSTWGEDAPKKRMPVLLKFFTVNPLTRTFATGVTTLKSWSTVPWTQKPLRLLGAEGAWHGGDCVGGDAGGCRIVCPWPAPRTVRLLVTSTLSRNVPPATLMVSPGLAAFTAAWMD